MKYHPILFNTEMVRAILDGRKTQTRRVIADKLLNRFDDLNPDNFGDGMPSYETEDGQLILLSDLCPYKIGDRLWVRESFTYWEDDEFGGDYLEYRTGHRVSLGEWEYPHPIYDHCIGRFGKWTPSIHAPRWASRLTLEIIGVRVERLQDISEEDAIAEGVICDKTDSSWHSNGAYAKGRFKSLWQSVYGTWDQNPWVWVIEFKRVEE